MEHRDDLAAAPLETLPVTVAVLDADGEILLTNRVWREFEAGETTADHVGVDYVATTELGDDEHAERAVDAATDLAAVEDATVLAEYEDGGLVLELELGADGDIVTTLAERGAVIEGFDADADADADIDADDRLVELALELPNGQSARSVYDTLEDRSDRVELVCYRETDRRTQTPQDIVT